MNAYKSWACHSCEKQFGTKVGFDNHLEYIHINGNECSPLQEEKFQELFC